MEIRKGMSKRGIQREPGHSLLELDGEMYEFVARMSLTGIIRRFMRPWLRLEITCKGKDMW